MSNEKSRILIVDDSPEDIQFVIEALKNDYTIIVATNGKKALQMAEQDPQPDVVLLDVDMPEMNGYETCRHLKENDKCNSIDVIFISAHDTTDEKLQGYEAGGLDYIIKPVNPEEIKQKVSLAVSNNKLKKELESEKANAMQVAMGAITSTGELGVILAFLKESFSIKSQAALAKLIVDSLHSYSLTSVVQIRSSLEDCFYGSKMPVSPLEKELLPKLSSTGRIVTHDKRLILNFGVITLLIKNMPIENQDLCGRLRDNLAILMDGAVAMQTSIERGLLDELRNKKLKELINKTNEALPIISTEQKELKKKNMQIMDEVLNKVESSFSELTLTEEQEDKIISIIQSGVSEALDNLDKGVEVDRQMSLLIEDLNNFANL